MVAKTVPLKERLWSRVVWQPNGCWDWTGARNKKGHGVIGLPTGSSRKQDAPYRIVYEMLVGPIPEGAHMDHLCQNPPCCNPQHLEPVSLWENLRRSDRTPAVINAAKTHCLRGHEFTPENTYVARTGRRHCRACVTARKAEKNA